MKRVSGWYKLVLSLAVVLGSLPPVSSAYGEERPTANNSITAGTYSFASEAASGDTQPNTPEENEGEVSPGEGGQTQSLQDGEQTEIPGDGEQTASSGNEEQTESPGDEDGLKAEVAADYLPVLLFSDDFEDGSLEGWTFNNIGNVRIDADPLNPDNHIMRAVSGDELIATVSGDIGSDYIVEADVFLRAGGFPGMLARYSAPNFYHLQLENNVKLRLTKGGTELATAPALASGSWHKLRLIVEGSLIRAYVDDKYAFEAIDTSFATGTVGFRSRWEWAGYDNVSVWSVLASPLAAPANLRQTAVSASSVPLAWDDVPDAETYRLYRSETETGSLRLIFEGAQTSYTDAGLMPGNDYYYVVASETAKYESRGTSLKVTTGLKAAAPEAPAYVSATPDSISLAWNAVQDAQGYKLYRALSENGPFTVVYSGNDTEATIGGLQTGATYYFAMVYMDANQDESERSALLSAETELALPATVDELPGRVVAYKFDGSAEALPGGSLSAAATLAGGTSWTAGKNGQAIDLNGSNGHVVLPNQLLSGVTDFTLALWVQVDAGKSWARIFDFGPDTSRYMFLSPQTGTAESRFVFKRSGVPEEIVGTGGSLQRPGQWVHYAMTLTGGTAVLYVNGNEVARKENVVFKPADLGGTTLNYLGRSLFSADPYLDGKLDDFYFFNRALAPKEIGMFTAEDNIVNVDADLAALTLGGPEVYANLSLPATGARGSKISWSSSHPSALSASGEVNRPAEGEADIPVVLTATVRDGSVTRTKAFPLLVKAQLNDSDAVDADLALLALTDLDVVTAHLKLPKQGANRTSIAWSASEPDYFRPDGVISRPAIGEADLALTVTATVSRGGVQRTKTFPLTIAAQDDATGYLFAYNKVSGGASKLHYAVSRNGTTWTELGSNEGVVQPIAGGSEFKLISEDRWIRYEYDGAAWSAKSRNHPDSGNWTTVASSLPSGALAGSFAKINEETWTELVHGLSTPNSLNVVTLTTKPGVAPRLPEFVRIVYNNGLYTNVDVVWQPLSSTALETIGSHIMTGTVAGFSTAVTATVEVLDQEGLNEKVRNGEFWYDTDGAMIQAHGGDFLKVGDTYYWFGEDKGHNGATLQAVNVYASKDLRTWEFRNAIITARSHPELASSKIERPKVVYNEAMGKYVMWGHWEEAGNYNQANVVVAVSDTVDGEYRYLYRFQPGGFASRDFTVFQDDGGSAYLFGSTNNNYDMNVYRLTPDYRSVEAYLYTAFKGEHREAPAITQKDGLYYLITSGSSGWYPNQGRYSTTRDIEDPEGWSENRAIGNPSTYYTQPSFIFKIEGDGEATHVYAGDRWNPDALRTSKYVWLPLEFGDGTVKLNYTGEWALDADTGNYEVTKEQLVSQNKPATATPAGGAQLANDGIEDNYYDMTNVAYPVTWQVDLEQEYDLSRIDLSWREWNGSEVYYRYKVEVSKNGTDFELAVDASGNRSTSFLSHGLSGSWRYVKVTVSGAYGHTNNPDRLITWYGGIHEVKVFAEVEQEATAPQNLSAGETSANSVTLSWTAVEGANGYHVYRSESEEGQYARITSAMVKQTSYKDSGLQSATAYYYKASAVYDSGESPLTLPVSAKTKPSSGNGGSDGGTGGTDGGNGGTDGGTGGTDSGNGGTGGNNGSAGGGGDPVGAGDSLEVDVNGGSIHVKANSVTDGILKIELTAEQVKQAMNDSLSGSVEIVIAGPEGEAATGATVTLPVANLLSNKTNDRLTLRYGSTSIRLNSLSNLDENSETMTVSISKGGAGLLQGAAHQVKRDTLIDLTVLVDGKEVDAYGGYGWNGNALIELDYGLRLNEKSHQIVIYRVMKDGKLQVVKHARHEGATVKFAPTENGNYVVGYAGAFFRDVESAHWANSVIESLAAREVLQGLGDGSFAPAKAVTRAEFLTLLLNALDLANESGKGMDFIDVAATDWYYDSIAAATGLGIVNGKGDGKFGANEAVTRQDMAVMLTRALKAKGWATGATSQEGVFADESGISAYAAGAVAFLQGHGVIQGFGDGSYKPQQSANRAQAATVIYKLLDGEWQED